MSSGISAVSSGMATNAVSGASWSKPPQQKMTNLYNAIDTTGTGSITQAQFNQAFQSMNPPAAFQSAGANAVWNALDPTGSGQVSQTDFISGMKSLMYQLRQGSSGTTQTAAAATQGLVNITA